MKQLAAAVLAVALVSSRTVAAFEAGFPQTIVPLSPAAKVRVLAEEPATFVRATTDGKGSLLRAGSARPFLDPVDLTDRFIELRLRVRDAGTLFAMEVHLVSGESGNDYFAFSLPTFADPAYSVLPTGGWHVVTFGFGAARIHGNPDRATIRSLRWLVRDNATGPAVVDWSQIDSTPSESQGLATIAFDDGYDEHFQIAAPAMARYGFRGIAYVAPDEIGDTGYMTSSEVHRLGTEYGWDIGAHHVDALTGFEPEELSAVLTGVQNTLGGWGFSEGARHLAYPMGKHDTRNVLPLVRKRFHTARLAGGGPETLPPGDLHRLRVMNVLSTTHPEEIAEWARSAIQHRHWIILMFHFLVEHEPARETEYRVADFARAMKLLHETQIQVLPLSQVLGRGVR